jgi:hypothetical protein
MQGNVSSAPVAFMGNRWQALDLTEISNGLTLFTLAVRCDGQMS